MEIKTDNHKDTNDSNTSNADTVINNEKEDKETMEGAQTRSKGKRDKKPKKDKQERRKSRKGIQGKMKLPQGELNYSLCGRNSGDEEIFVLLHGLRLFSLHFKELQEHLLQRYPNSLVLSFDFLGFGSSDAPENAKYDASFFMNQVSKLLNFLEIEKKMTLIGYDLGGAVAVLYALEYPSKVSKLVLISPAGLSSKRFESKNFFPLPSKLFRRGQKKDSEIIRQDFSNPDQCNNFQWAQQLVKAHHDNNKQHARAYQATLKLQREFRDLGELGKQVMILWGDKDTMKPGYQVAFPSATHYSVVDAGHACFLENPTLFHLAISDFLEGRTPTQSLGTPLKERYHASVVLAAAGDAIGFKNGLWDYQTNGKYLHDELRQIGGIGKIVVNKKSWRLSDDSITHMATAEALVGEWSNKRQLFDLMAGRYVESFKDMSGRNPGVQCGKAAPFLEKKEWNRVPFSAAGNSNDAAVRTMCIGLMFPAPNQLDDLITVSIEAARMIHNHPVGILSAVCSALFTSYALQSVPVGSWGRKMVQEVLPRCYKYLQDSGRDIKDYKSNSGEHWNLFEKKWREYLLERNLMEGDVPTFPEIYGVNQREQFYKSLSHTGVGGSSGHDSVIIAYDALLGSGMLWEEFLLRAAIHGGNGGTTASIGAAWFGALYGFHSIPEGNIKDLEYRDRLDIIAAKLFEKSAVTEAALRANNSDKLSPGVDRKKHSDKKSKKKKENQDNNEGQEDERNNKAKEEDEDSDGDEEGYTFKEEEDED